MSASSSSSSAGIGFPSALTILFIGLKLTHVIDWSWFWVLSPMWIAGAIGLFIAIVALVIAFFIDRQERQLRSHINRLNR